VIYLASKSPRRRDLLKQLGVAFEELRLREAPGRIRDVVEESLDGEPAAHYVERIARTKASVGWKRIEQRGLIPYPVLGADTEVVQGNEIFGNRATLRTRPRCCAGCPAGSTMCSPGSQ